MIRKEFTVIDGIRCFDPGRCSDFDDYPEEGFDLTVAIELKSFWCRSRTRLLTTAIRRLLTPGEVRSFFELGCGTGTLLTALEKEEGLAIAGSELYIDGLRHATKKMPDVSFYQLDATTCPFEDEFDIVGAFDVIEHIDDDVLALSNFHTMLKPGGTLLLTVPQYPFMWSRIDDLVSHKRRYRHHELVTKAEEAGFTVEYCSSYLFTLFPFMLVSRLLDRLRGNTAVEEENVTDAIAERVSFPPLLNTLFDKIMRLDEWLIARDIPLPFGGSLYLRATKRA